MNYENHNNIVAAISIFTDQGSHILGNPLLVWSTAEGGEGGEGDHGERPPLSFLLVVICFNSVTLIQ